MSDKILRLTPALVDYLWGGRKLIDLFAKGTDRTMLAESWELSVHPDGESTLPDGTPLSQYVAAHPEMLGAKAGGKMPLLVKFIDAAQPLSIQVHPDAAYAAAHPGAEEKNEMWIVMDCDPGAFLYIGFNRDMTPDEVAQRIADNTLLEVLNKVPTHPGESYYIPAGTVHAIGAGNLICEVQQSSNTTYRLYDFGRRDANGNLRQLHIQESLDTLSCAPYVNQSDNSHLGETCTLCTTPYFTAKVQVVKGADTLSVPEDCFLSVICTKGEGTLGGEAIKAGDSLLVSAGAGSLPLAGDMTLMLFTL